MEDFARVWLLDISQDPETYKWYVEASADYFQA